MASYTFTNVDRQPHDQPPASRSTADTITASARTRTARSRPRAACQRRLRRQPVVHHRRQPRLPHRRRAGRRRVGRAGGQLHLHQRDRQPHDQRQLRDQQLHASPPRRGAERLDLALGQRGDRRLRRQPVVHSIAASPCYHIADVLVGRQSSVGPVGSYAFDRRRRQPHHQRQLRDRQLRHQRRRRGPNGAISPSGLVQRRLRRRQDVHHHRQPLLPHRRRAGRTARRSGPVGSYTFTNVTATAQHQRAASRSTATRMTASAGANGSIAPERQRRRRLRAPTNLLDHRRTPATTSPTCWWTGASVGPVGSYTFDQRRRQPHHQRQLRDRQLHASTASAGPNGSIAPSGAVTVDYGANQPYHDRRQTPATASPTCWSTESSAGPVGSYTFTDVDRQPHHQRQLRDQQLHHHRHRRERTARSRPRAAVQRRAAAPTRRSPSPPAPATTSPTCWSTASSVGPVGSYTFTNVTAQPHHQRQLRDQRTVQPHRVGGAERRDLAGGVTPATCGASQTYTITRRPLLRTSPDVLVDGSSVGRGEQLHLQQRGRQPHHLGQLRHRRVRSRSPRSRTPTARSHPRCATVVTCGNSQSYTITRGLVLSRRRRCWSTACRSARSRATPSAASPPTTPSRPASRSTSSPSRPRPDRAEPSRSRCRSRSTAAMPKAS